MRVIDAQHLITFLDVEVEEGRVPPKVVGEIRRAPAGFVVAHEANAALLTARHLHHMADGVHGPRVVGHHGERLAAHFFGQHEIAVFFQTEGIEAEHIFIARHAFVPKVEDPSDDVTNANNVSQQQVRLLDQFQREQVERVLCDDGVPFLNGAVEITVDPRLYSFQMPALTVIGVGGAFCSLLHGVDHDAVNAGFHGLRQPARLEQPTHDEVGVLFQNGVDLGNRIAAKRQAQLDGALKPFNRVLVGVGNRNAARVLARAGRTRVRSVHRKHSFRLLQRSA